MGNSFSKFAAFMILIIIIFSSGFTEGIYYGEIEDLRNKIAPLSGTVISIELGDLVIKMIKEEAINVTLFNIELENNRGYGFTDKDRISLFQESDNFILINNETIYFYYYIFWALGFTNNNSLLRIPAHMFSESISPIGKARYGSLEILNLSEMSQDIVDNISLNSFRPCCNTPILALDGSHSFAALGFVEFLVHKGINEEDLARNLLIFNTYWFREQYGDIALFMEEQGFRWEDISPEDILGYKYSSLEAYQIIRKYLVENGLYEPLEMDYKLDFFSRFFEEIIYSTIIILALIAMFLFFKSGKVYLKLLFKKYSKQN